MKRIREYINEINRFEIDVIELMSQNKLNLRQLLYCVSENDYQLKYKDDYMTKTWSYKNIAHTNFVSLDVKEWSYDKNVHNDDRDENGYLLPARMYTDGSKEWLQDGYLHNDNRDENGYLLPAVIDADGSKKWLQDGYLHNDDRDENNYLLPAVIDVDGSKEWLQYGKRHNTDRDENNYLLPAMVDTDGLKEWFINDSKITRFHYNLDRFLHNILIKLPILLILLSIPAMALALFIIMLNFI